MKELIISHLQSIFEHSVCSRLLRNNLIEWIHISFVLGHFSISLGLSLIKSFALGDYSRFLEGLKINQSLTSLVRSSWDFWILYQSLLYSCLVLVWNINVLKLEELNASITVGVKSVVQLTHHILGDDLWTIEKLIGVIFSSSVIQSFNWVLHAGGFVVFAIAHEKVIQFVWH